MAQTIDNEQAVRLVVAGQPYRALLQRDTWAYCGRTSQGTIGESHAMLRAAKALVLDAARDFRDGIDVVDRAVVVAAIPSSTAGVVPSAAVRRAA